MLLKKLRFHRFGVSPAGGNDTLKSIKENNSMKAKVLLLSFIFSFVVGSAYAQIEAIEGYDRTGIDEPGQLAGTSLVQDLDEIKKRAIDNIINRIRKGDPNVLKYVVYDVFQEVHKAILQESRERSAKSQDKDKGAAVSFYDVVGGKAALPSFYGCFDNQDPKVRLRCIGFLGDWIDDMGIAMNDIGRQAQDRLHSNIETRIEVHYGLILLTLKVLRKVTLNKIWNGDMDELKSISPEHFVVLVHREPFIREMFCIPRDVRLRSIRLLQWWLYYDEGAGVYWYRNEGEEDNELTLTNQFTPWRHRANELGYRKKVYSDYLLYRNYGGHPNSGILAKDVRKQQGYGYQDPGKFQDIASLYDLRYFRYSSDEQLKTGEFQNEQKYLDAIFAGLSNTSLFVRENCARLLVRLTDGDVGFMKRADANYQNIRFDGTSADFVRWDEEQHTQRAGNRLATTYELLDDTNSVVGVQGILSRLAKNAKHQTTLRNAWRDVKFAQFMDVHEMSRPANAKKFPAGPYDSNDGIKLSRNVIFSDADNSWGYKYNYRTDIADLMRRFNLGRELEYCERKRVEPEVVTTQGHYFVEDLFDLDEQSRAAFTGSNVMIPLWHGKDEIKDEVFEP